MDEPAFAAAMLAFVAAMGASFVGADHVASVLYVTALIGFSVSLWRDHVADAGGETDA